MAPPPASIAQMTEQFNAAPASALPQAVRLGSRQTTLANEATLRGIGLHSGNEVCMTLRPAAANTGIEFVRTDVAAGEGRVAALTASICEVTLSSKIGNQHGHMVGTIEHLMAALSGLGVDNAIVEIDAAEVPIMDGSAKPFAKIIKQAGIQELDAARRIIRIVQAVRVENGDSYCELVPDNERVFEAEIDFDCGAIGRQAYELSLDADDFDADVINARTFCMAGQVEAMHEAGLALGGSMENAIVVDGDKVLNEEGLRSNEEFVQHKLLDAVGDLFLAGMPIIGRYRGYKSGHALHNELLKELFANEDCFELIDLADADDILAAE